MKKKTGRSGMSWIEGMDHMRNGEMDRIYDWSVQNTGSFTSAGADTNAESYFVYRNTDSYIKEYVYETFAEVRCELEQLWSGDACMEKIIIPVAVSAMKNKPKGQELKTCINALDEYIYIF